MSLAPGYEVDWNLVRTFVSVVEAGSLAGASRALNLAHPTVARHVQQLEAQLGVVLFERSSAGLTLNDSGARLAEVADRMRREAMTLESVGESVRSDTTGRVRITIAEVFNDLIPALLAPLKDLEGAAERYIELIVSPQRLNLLDREADIAVRHVRPDQNELVCRRVGELPMRAWVSESYIAKHGFPELSRMAGHRFIDGLSTRGFSQAMNRMGFRIPDAQLVFRTDSLQSQRQAAALGWGIVALPDYLGRQTPGLVPVFADAPESVALPIWLVARPAVRQQQLLRVVFDTLAASLSGRFADGAPAQSSVEDSGSVAAGSASSAAGSGLTASAASGACSGTSGAEASGGDTSGRETSALNA
ncbi:MAG: LysR family transcriptional regulator [Pseudomonadales bacterium]